MADKLQAGKMSRARLSEASTFTLNQKTIRNSPSDVERPATVDLASGFPAENSSADLSLTRAKARACGSKVRTGCITCKTRRVKCDEQKPDCLRCRSTGRTCDGYISIDQNKKLRPLRNGGVSKFEPTSLTFDIPGSVRERRSFYFFCARTAPQLSGYFQSDFWGRFLLQTTHLEPAVRHAVVSIGSVHEQYEAGRIVDETESSGAFALQQYNTAISHLVNASRKRETQTADVILMSCLLFISFEMLRANYAVAFSHVQAGLKILSSIKSRGIKSGASVCRYVELQALESLFLRLDTQSVKMGIAPYNVVLNGDDHENQTWGRGPDKIAPFTSLDDARVVLDQYWNFIIHFRGSVLSKDNVWQPAAQDGRKLYYKTKMDEWLLRFETYLERSRSTLQSKHDNAITLLRICHAEAYLMLCDTGVINHEGLWDELASHFELIITLAENLVKLKCLELDTAPGGSFNLELGFISALFVTATRYRHPVRRRRAIRLLELSPVQEGITTGYLGWVYATKIVALEEEGLTNPVDCTSVPVHRRVIAKDRLEFFISERRARLYFHRPRSAQDSTMMDYEEWFTW